MSPIPLDPLALTCGRLPLIVPSAREFRTIQKTLRCRLDVTQLFEMESMARLPTKAVRASILTLMPKAWVAHWLRMIPEVSDGALARLSNCMILSSWSCNFDEQLHQVNFI